MLEISGVAFTPGIDFGNHQANTHVRFAYTASVERLGQAVERLARFLPR
jgi:aspartate/methionine/tyrosine aminotransferase